MCVCVCVVQSGCWSESGEVCGMNGETYSSECLAWTVGGVLVDYLGPCRLVAGFHSAAAAGTHAASRSSIITK